MKREMTDEIRKRLSGLLPFAPGSSLPHTPEAFQKVEEAFRPRYHLRRFPIRVQKEIDSRISAGTLDREAMVWALSEGDVGERACGGWDNLVDLVNGETFSYSKEAIALQPDNTLSALFWKCMEFSGMTVLEREGLESLPASTSAPSSKAAEGADATQS